MIGQLWDEAEREVDEQCCGRLIVHRIPFQDWTALLGPKPHPALRSETARAFFQSAFSPQAFAWEAGLLAERLVEREDLDIIEAQEYEAPLYYFQLRRALELGPKKTPPCIVHLHSPTEFIARFNDWELGHPHFLTAKRLEDHSIATADALLCPGRYLARQAEAHYGIADNTIDVIPYPLGNMPQLERDAETWRHGAICYMGRLERRKGVLEWMAAAVSVAPEYPQAHFEFVGANVLSDKGLNGREVIARLVPKSLRPRFHFRGEQKRSSLPRFLAQARIAVVPSRWENFPNACMEAMASGLPVIASRDGGMVEMIEDDRTGWIARQSGKEGLIEALTRALKTPPEKIAEMGSQAAARIRQICDPPKIVDQQLDFRRRMVKRGAQRSLKNHFY